MSGASAKVAFIGNKVYHVIMVIVKMATIITVILASLTENTLS